MCSSPSTSSVVSTNSSPSCKVTLLLANIPRRISGPLVSAMVAITLPTLAAASLTNAKRLP